jgi:hypothetical protein
MGMGRILSLLVLGTGLEPARLAATASKAKQAPCEERFTL